MCKIAIACEGESLDSSVAEDFGSAPYFVIVDTGKTEAEVLKNGARWARDGDAAVARAVVAAGAEAVLASWILPDAMHVLEAAGIEIHPGIVGRAKDALTMRWDVLRPPEMESPLSAAGAMLPRAA